MQTPRGRDTNKKTNTAGKKVNALTRYFEEKKEMPVVHKNTKIMSENNVLLMSEIPLSTFGAPITRKTAVYTSKKTPQMSGQHRTEKEPITTQETDHVIFTL